MQRLALQGVRVVDLSQNWAGPSATGLLADLGAEVIKVESCRRPDPIRLAARGVLPEGDPGPRPWNRSGMVIERNRNKYGITLDLSQPKGKDIFKRLIKVSDVFVHNFRPAAIERLGLDYPALSQINPSLVMISMGGRGATGPERDSISYGNILEAESGLTSLAGYPGSLRFFGALAVPDPLGAYAAAGATVAALLQRRRSERGMFVDLSQLEVASSLILDALVGYSMTRTLPEPIGNRDHLLAPHGCYPCAGHDRWVTIAVGSDEEWQALCRAMGRESLTQDPRFATMESRLKHQDQLDDIIAAWTAPLTPAEVTEKLQALGVAAGPVFAVDELFTDPHLRAREWWVEYEQPGEVPPYPYRAIPIRLSEMPFSVRLPAPRLGEHNFPVLHKLLGMGRDEIEALEREGIIGDTPVGIDWFPLPTPQKG